MASLLSPTQAPSYATSTSETPKWMQDAIYNQINAATNVAQTPYQADSGQLVAGLSPYQQAAYQQTASNQGAWIPAVNQAQVGTGALTNTSAGAGAAQPYMNAAYGNSNFAATAQPYLQAGLNQSGLSAAMPYVNQADQNAYSTVQNYMNPYTQNVTDQIAKLGARNLSENLLPAVSDQFVKAGQFGGTRMGEFGSRALRDTQESVLNQQAQALQSGYGQALGAAQADASRQAGLAGTVGQLASSQQNALMQAGSTLGGLQQQQAQLQASLGSTAGQLASSGVSQRLAAQNQLASMAQQAQGMANTDASRLEAAGSAYQTQQQRELDAQYQQYQNGLNYPKTQLDWLSTQVRGMAPNVATTQTTQQSTPGLSPLAQIATGLSVGAGLGKLLGS